MASVSIHIVTHNSEAYIKQCVLCVLKQTHPGCSLLIIDNASTDATVKICKSLGVRTVLNTKNIGYAAAHNQALQITHSDYVLTLNPDVFLRPTFVHHIVRELHKDEQIGSACGLLFRIDHTLESPQCVDGAGLFMRKNRRQGLRYERAPVTSGVRTELIFGPDGAAAFYRRKMLEDIKIDNEVFDEDFFMHKEDVDVAWRAQRAGWKSIVVPQAQASHIRTFRAGQRNTVSPTLRRMGFRNRYLLIMKNDDWSYMFRDLLHIIWYDLKIFCYVIFLERSSFRVYHEVFLLRRNMLKKRAYIQRKWPNNKQAYRYFS